jgi:hypothetical protein
MNAFPSCTTCGSAVSEGAAFCGSCGSHAPIGSRQQPAWTPAAVPRDEWWETQTSTLPSSSTSSTSPVSTLPTPPTPPTVSPTSTPTSMPSTSVSWDPSATIVHTPASNWSAAQPAPPIPQQAVQPPHQPATKRPADRPRSRRVATVAAAVVGLSAIAGGSYLAVSTFLGEGGGASSPEAAVERLAEGLAAGDLVAATSSLAPDEIVDARETAQSVLDGLRRTGLLTAGSETGEVFDGWSIVTDLDYSTDELADGVARVDITGSVDVEGIPGLVERAEADDEWGPPPWDEDDFTIDDVEPVAPHVIVVQLDGGWYVSPTLTAASLAYEAASEDTTSRPDWDRVTDVESDAVDAAEPTDLADTIAAAIEDRDVDALAATMSPPAARALRVFADILDDEIEERELDGEQFVDEVSIEIDETGTEGVVTVDGLAWLDLNTFEQNEVDDPFDFGDGGGDRVTGQPSLELVLAQVDGNWRLDPYATAARLVQSTAGSITRPVILSELGRKAELTPVTATIGSRVTAGPSEYAVFEIATPAGELFTVDGGEDSDVEIYSQDPQGDWVDQWDEASTVTALGNVYRSGGSAVRIVVTPYAEEFVPSDHSLSVRRPIVQDVDFPSRVSGELEPGQSIVLRFTVDEEPAPWQFDDLDEFDLYTADGDYVGSTTVPARGEYVLVRSNSEASADSFSIGASTRAPTLLDTSIVLDGEWRVVDVQTVQGREYVVALIPDFSVDVVVVVADSQGDIVCEGDTGFDGDAETCVFTAEGSVMQVGGRTYYDGATTDAQIIVEGR